jgi:hypothetical protein
LLGIHNILLSQLLWWLKSVATINRHKTKLYDRDSMVSAVSGFLVFVTYCIYATKIFASIDLKFKNLKNKFAPKMPVWLSDILKTKLVNVRQVSKYTCEL